VPGDLLHHVQGHPAAHAVGRQRPAEAVRAHPLQAQQGTRLAEGLIRGLAALRGVG
jgi:hypothetical protein